VPVKEGSELTLECAAEGGNPPPVLAWGMTLSQATLDGPEQPPDNLTVLPSTSGRRSGAHLKVLRGHHNATIACVARHITLTMPMNASILLDVQCEYTTRRREATTTRIAASIARFLRNRIAREKAGWGGEDTAVTYNAPAFGRADCYLLPIFSIFARSDIFLANIPARRAASLFLNFSRDSSG